MAYSDLVEKALPDTPPPEYELSCEQVKTLPMDNGVELGTVTVILAQDFKDGHLLTTRPNPSPASSEDDIDPWAPPELQDQGVKWSDLEVSGKVKRVIQYLVKFVILLLLLYFFICSLDLLSSAFRLLGGKTAGEVFTDNEVLRNPIAGLMIGILATVLVQSSSTSTSIIVTMVASGIITVEPAIPIIMGANIGTSLTNTIVSLAQSAERNEFRRAFGGATVHDMFNWLAVIVLLPIEVATGFLYHLSKVTVQSFELHTNANANKEMLTVLTKPFTSLIIQMNKNVIEKIAMGDTSFHHISLIKQCGHFELEHLNATNTQNLTRVQNLTHSLNLTFVQNITLMENMFYMKNVTYVNGSQINKSIDDFKMNSDIMKSEEECLFLFNNTGLSDTIIGFILMAVSLGMLCTCLILMVKLLHSILRGQIATVIKKTVNSDFPGHFSFLTDYVAVFIGAGMTILVQSSSVFTSAMTPLVGLGVISLERMYPLTLGSNIGTTVTGMLAALASSGKQLESALQIAICHLYFNVSGILIFFPIPFMRWPIRLARFLGNTTAKYRWFAILYLIFMFFLLPGTVFGLSILGKEALLGVGVPILAILIFIVVINVLQRHHPQMLPRVLKTWNWLPECLRSLDPLDKRISKVRTWWRKCCPFCSKRQITHRKHTFSESSARLLDSTQSSRCPSSNSSCMPSRCNSHITITEKTTCV